MWNSKWFARKFFVAIFLATLEPNSAIRERLQLMVNEPELNYDGLYEVQVSRNSTKALSVSVFPRVDTNSLS